MDRRNFMRGLAATASLPAAGLFATAAPAQAAAQALSITSRTLEVNGKAAKVYGLSPGLFTLKPGETNLVDLTNTLSEPAMLHWHGITPQWQFDGVPDSPQPALKPGETRRFELPGGTGGTHWMHAHTLQEQNLLAAPLIVRSDGLEQEVVMMLHDFSFTPAEELLTKLRSGSSMPGMAGMDHSKHMMNMGGMKGMSSMSGMSGMGGMAMDINDIDYDAYLANDRTLRDPKVTQVEKGARLRLRIINGATATAFMIDTGTLAASLIAVDGQDVVPLKGRAFPVAMGQRLDLALEIPREGGAFPILALREGARERTGLILATPGARVSKIAEKGPRKTPVLDLDLELRLRAAKPLAQRKVDKAFAVILSGNMQGYDWSLQLDRELSVKQGDRVAIEMRNMSMMTHPMHLHGHHFQVTAVNGEAFSGALRDTVFIPAMASVTVAFDAANPGQAWPLHCHHLYHMASGMMTMLAYEA